MWRKEDEGEEAVGDIKHEGDRGQQFKRVLFKAASPTNRQRRPQQLELLISRVSRWCCRASAGRRIMHYSVSV
ncbi:hypothetical protein EYF80_042579 [Liparis tanakae]|uniref:Uncharacterized protein n=1 Tax=Liparis tanakae TaxID=230148 RepID=A0A4Z2G1U7_9TELE|nr:hypothetical protein EYF80_042579 [Liparis tanakae]